VIICPDCGKRLSSATNEERCPGSLRKDGLHPIFVVNMRDYESTEECYDALG
jgi:hypothetical protein